MIPELLPAMLELLAVQPRELLAEDTPFLECDSGVELVASWVEEEHRASAYPTSCGRELTARLVLA